MFAFLKPGLSIKLEKNVMWWQKQPEDRQKGRNVRRKHKKTDVQGWGRGGRPDQWSRTVSRQKTRVMSSVKHSGASNPLRTRLEPHTQKKTNLFPIYFYHNNKKNHNGLFRIHFFDWGPTWSYGNSVSFPGYNADVLLHGSRDEALENSYVAPQWALIRHPHSIGLPENYANTQIVSETIIFEYISISNFIC